MVPPELSGNFSTSPAYAEASRLISVLVTLLTDNQMEEKAVRTLSLLASAYIMQRQFEVANRYAQQALHLSEQRQDKGDTGVILSVLSYIAHMQDDLETAQTYAEQSLSLLQTIGDLGSQAMTFYKLGGIYLAKNQPALALEASEKSLALCQQSQFYLQQGWTLIQLAKCCQAMEKQNAAQQYWRDAWKMAQSLQNKALLDAVREQSPISHQPDSVQDPA